MRILLIRHGQSTINCQNNDNYGGGEFVSGQNNPPLTSLGIAQAKALANKPIVNTVNQVFSSDLERAYETALHIFGGSKVIYTSSLLRERTLGIFDGQDLNKIRETEEFRKYFENPHLQDFRLSFKTRVPGGENLTDVCYRVEDFLGMFEEELIGRVTAIVTHGAFIKCFLKTTLQLSEREALNIKVPNCQIFVLDRIEDLRFRLVI